MIQLIRLPGGWLNLALVRSVFETPEEKLTIQFSNGEKETLDRENSERLSEALTDLGTEYLLPEVQEIDDTEWVSGVITPYVRGQGE
ncbi:MAG: hypothetical protein WBA57_08705 [Elainellaceae cyanobacterium]